MDRKQSAIIRIIAWSVTAIALCSILMIGLRGGFGNIGGSILSFGFGNYYKDADKYQAGETEIQGDQVKDLLVNWVDGSVNVEVYDGETIQISEVSSRKLKEKEQLHYYHENGRLNIQYQESGKKIYSSFWMGSRRLDKQLTIKIPAKTVSSLGTVSIDTVSSDTRIEGVSAKRIKLDSVSGDFTLVNCQAEDFSMDSTSGGLSSENLTVNGRLETDTTSGDVNLKGRFVKLTLDSVSGDINIDSEVCPEDVDTDTTSGDVVLRIPDNEGFTYEKDTVSGSLKCDFPVKQWEDKGSYKEGTASFNFDTVSGDINIKKR